MATTNALPRDDQGNEVAYENNLERLHAQADEETVVFNAIGLADLIEEQRASHGALVSRLNGMFIKHLESTWVPRTLQKLAAEKERLPFEHALLGVPPAHEEEALPQVRDVIVKEVEGVLDRAAPSLLKEYLASVLHPMERDLRRVVQQAMKDAFRVEGVACRFENDVDHEHHGARTLRHRSTEWRCRRERGNGEDYQGGAGRAQRSERHQNHHPPHLEP